MTMLADVLWSMRDPRSPQVVAEAVALLESEPPGPELVAAYTERARLESLRGESRKATEGADRAMALASRLGLEEPAKALGYRGMARCDLGDVDGLDDVRRALALTLERGEGREAAVLYNNLSRHLWVIDGPASALANYREGIEFAERRGIAELANWMASARLDCLFDFGSWDAVIEEVALLADRLQSYGSARPLIWARFFQASVIALRGGAADALVSVEWAIEYARDSSSIENRVAALAVAAMASLGAGDPKGAATALSVLERTPHVRESTNYPSLLPAMVRTAVAAGDLALADRLASGFGPNYPYTEHALCATRAILAEATGETEQAAGLYAEAAGRWERFGVVPERGFALLGQGRCLLVLGRPVEAVGALRSAREVLSALGALPFLAETDALLEQATALTS